MDSITILECQRSIVTCYIYNFNDQPKALLAKPGFDAIRGNIKIVSPGRFDFLETVEETHHLQLVQEKQ